jgi:hypothetical protein
LLGEEVDMNSQRPDHDDGTAHDTAGRIIDDKTAEARERIGRIENSASGTAADVQNAAREVEGQLPEREIAGQTTVDEKAFERSLAELEAASRDLKERIIDEKRRNDMPIDSALGNPETEKQNADGRNDLPDRDDE